jgi:hypothetical protein
MSELHRDKGIYVDNETVSVRKIDLVILWDIPDVHCIHGVDRKWLDFDPNSLKNESFPDSLIIPSQEASIQYLPKVYLRCSFLYSRGINMSTVGLMVSTPINGCLVKISMDPLTISHFTP